MEGLFSMKPEQFADPKLQTLRAHQKTSALAESQMKESTLDILEARSKITLGKRRIFI
jgi:hypothetical protein